MSENSAFKSENVMAVTTSKHGLLEELHLPPRMISFIRAYQQLLIIALVAAVVVIVGWNWYAQYAANREDRAAALLAKATTATEREERRTLLAEVGKEYGGTGAALWSVIEEAHLAYESGDLAGAVRGYEAALKELSSKNPVQPLVQMDLAQAYTEQQAYGKAIALYEKIKSTAGFAGLGYLGLGRVHALAGDAAKAREALQAAIALENIYPPLREAAQAQLAQL